MFAAKQGFYTLTNLGPVQSDYWIAVFDDFIPDGVAVSPGAGAKGDGCLLAGTYSTGGNKGGLVKLDHYGTIVFQKQSTGAVNSLTKVISDGNQYAHVVGSTNENGTSRPYTAVFDATGTLVWQKYISNVTSGIFNDIIYQDTSSNGFNNMPVGRSNSTAVSQFMAFDQANGTLYDQQKWPGVNTITSITKDFSTASANLFHAGVDTDSTPDDIKITKMDNNYGTITQKTISDGTLNLINPYVQFNSNRILCTARDSGSDPYALVFDSSLSLINQRNLNGAITSAGLLTMSKVNGTFFITATLTNNTIWYGLLDYDGITITDQNNLYFGTPGTDSTSVNGVSGSQGFTPDGIYIIGQTDYYGGTKGFVARLPYSAIPGTGVYGASNEIHLDISTYMSLTTSSLTVTNVTSPSPSSTGFANTTSTLTQATGTDTYTLNEAN
jgi:hypothetical protein